MSATGYSVDLQDIHFVLFEQLQVDKNLAHAFPDFDAEMYGAMIDEAAKLAIEVIGPVNGPGDAQGCTLDDEGNVTTPDGYIGAWKALAEGGWLGMEAPEEWGGIGLPHAVAMAVSEILTGACTGLTIYSGLTNGVAALIREYADEDLKARCLPKLYAGEWAGTMLLTEAGAGTSVGDNRTRAIRTETDGMYHLEGEKIFISGGDQDFTDNIVHIALARTEDAPAGTRGLSIFAVPKVNWDGTRNDAKVVGIEHKMGINGSATCTIALGADGPCTAYRIGAEGQGMAIMFFLMNHARIAVGVQGLATAAAAYQNSLAYCQERVQGTSVSDFKNPDAKPVTIVNHPDVRRMLMFQRVWVQLSRSLLYTTAYRADLAHHHQDEKERLKYENLVSLLTPICKAHVTDVGFESCRLAVQCLGGYGYINEYPVAQHLRDNKIFSIYEGTNGIQAMDLLGRKMRQGSGALFMQWLQDANSDVAKAKAAGLDDHAAAVQKAIQALGASAMHLGGLARSGGIDKAMVHATPFLTQFGVVALATHALEQATLATEALTADPKGSRATFYRGKLLNLDFYIAQMLPSAVGLGKTIRSGDASCLDEALFS